MSINHLLSQTLFDELFRHNIISGDGRIIASEEELKKYKAFRIELLRDVTAKLYRERKYTLNKIEKWLRRTHGSIQRKEEVEPLMKSLGLQFTKEGMVEFRTVKDSPKRLVKPKLCFWERKSKAQRQSRKVLKKYIKMLDNWLVYLGSSSLCVQIFLRQEYNVEKYRLRRAKILKDMELERKRLINSDERPIRVRGMSMAKEVFQKLKERKTAGTAKNAEKLGEELETKGNTEGATTVVEPTAGALDDPQSDSPSSLEVVETQVADHEYATISSDLAAGEPATKPKKAKISIFPKLDNLGMCIIDHLQGKEVFKDRPKLLEDCLTYLSESTVHMQKMESEIQKRFPKPKAKRRETLIDDTMPSDMRRRETIREMITKDILPLVSYDEPQDEPQDIEPEVQLSKLIEPIREKWEKDITVTSEEESSEPFFPDLPKKKAGIEERELRDATSTMEETEEGQGAKPQTIEKVKVKHVVSAVGEIIPAISQEKEASDGIAIEIPEPQPSEEIFLKDVKDDPKEPEVTEDMKHDEEEKIDKTSSIVSVKSEDLNDSGRDIRDGASTISDADHGKDIQDIDGVVAEEQDLIDKIEEKDALSDINGTQVKGVRTEEITNNAVDDSEIDKQGIRVKSPVAEDQSFETETEDAKQMINYENGSEMDTSDAKTDNKLGFTNDQNTDGKETIQESRNMVESHSNLTSQAEVGAENEEFSSTSSSSALSVRDENIDTDKDDKDSESENSYKTFDTKSPVESDDDKENLKEFSTSNDESTGTGSTIELQEFPSSNSSFLKTRKMNKEKETDMNSEEESSNNDA